MKRRIVRALVTSALIAGAVAGTAGWAGGTAQEAVTGPPPGAAAWHAERIGGQTPPDPATAAPSRVAEFFAGLDAGQRNALARRHPLVVGNLDGAPLSLRYAANRTALGRERDRLAARADDPSRTVEDRRAAREAADRLGRLRAPGRHVLAFDPRGRGQLAEVHGDLERARRTAVIVPGSDIDLASFGGPGPARPGTPDGMARALRARMTEAEPGTPTAVVAWAGYTTPVGVGPDAATSRLADAGAPRLRRFLRGLAARNVAAPTVLCHSYGTVVCGAAVRPAGDGGTSATAAGTGPDGVGVAQLVLFGSPGTDRDSAAELGLRVPVWAARAERDWIGAVPNVRFLGLGHGTDPTADDFGARVVTTRGVEGHAGYLAPHTASLGNFAAITLGSYDRVRCAREGCAAGL